MERAAADGAPISYALYGRWTSVAAVLVVAGVSTAWLMAGWRGSDSLH